jgi:hypothetical protein
LEHEVYLLANDLNIANEACGKVHVNLLQKRFPEYQIIILNNDLDIFHKGPWQDKKIFILYREENVNNEVVKHFDLLTSMPAFFQKRHFCT